MEIENIVYVCFYEAQGQPTGSVYNGKAADTWAVGVTLYCMVLGKYPFLGETLQDTYEKVRKGMHKFSHHLFISPTANKYIVHFLPADC